MDVTIWTQTVAGQRRDAMTKDLAATIRRWTIPMAVGAFLGAAGVQALHAQPHAMTRTPLTKADLTGVDGKEVFMTLIEAQPGAEFPAHIHHGDEFAFVIEGALEGFVGQTAAASKAGETFHAQREIVHGGKVVGNVPLKLLAVHIVDKGKPLTEPASR
jgi:quercetin dioxygenase-like cupin family protein